MNQLLKEIIDGFLYKLDRYVSCFLPRNCHVWIIWKICRFREFKSTFGVAFSLHIPSMSIYISVVRFPKKTYGLPTKKKTSFFFRWMISRGILSFWALCENRQASEVDASAFHNPPEVTWFRPFRHGNDETRWGDFFFCLVAVEKNKNSEKGTGIKIGFCT